MLEKSGSYEDQARIDNLQELRSSIVEYDQRGASLAEFIENVSLISDETKEKVNKEDCINLMTIHSAKGLEFDSVFIMGAEENLFPSKRSLSDKNPYNGIEEERRLFYVAVTRARKELTIIYTSSRFLYGKTERSMPSRFISEIPLENKTFIRI
jgi:DNA helicase-2/ATP-dependent DNA helicase PcrA